MDRRGGLKRKLIDLNDQFTSWVNEQHAQCREELWLDGVNEYRRISEELIVSSKQLSSAAPESVQAPKSGSKDAPFLSFGKPTAQDQPKPPATEVDNSKINGGLFNFSSPAPSSTAPFKFGAAPSNLSNPFSFGTTPVAIKANGFGNQAPEDSAGVKEEEDGEPSAPIAVDPSADVLFNAQATLFIQTPNESQAWMSKGKGKLTLRRPKEAEGKPCYLVFTTESGRVLVNASLYKSLSPVLQEKGRLLLTLFFSENEAEDPSSQQRVVLIRLAGDKNKELAELIRKHAPK